MTQQNIITNKIKYFQTDYPDGVPLKILILDLDMSVDELQKILLNLEDQGILFIENEEYVKLVDNPTDETKAGKSPEEASILGKSSNNESMINKSPEDTGELITDKSSQEGAISSESTDDLNERELQAIDLIKNLIDDSGHIPRYALEGNLLYGDLKLSNLGVYNLILSLENRGLIKKIQLTDGEYYSI